MMQSLRRWAAPTIERQVLAWALSAVALGTCVLVGVSYLRFAHEMGEVFENNLKQVAMAVAHLPAPVQPVPASDPSAASASTSQTPSARIFEEQQEGNFDYVTAVWSQDGQLLHSSQPAIALAWTAPVGLSLSNIDGTDWYVYTLARAEGKVQAAQRASDRQALTQSTALRLIAPTLLILAGMAALLVWALRRGLAPLSVAAHEVRARSVETLHPLAEDAYPQELHPLIQALNLLMQRLGAALQVQRAFVADAAHELRTPVTALKLQLQLLERAKEAAPRAWAITELRAGIDRTQHLVEQLLQLSRLAPDAPPSEWQAVSLADLVRRRVQSFSAQAQQQGIQLQAQVSTESTMQGDAEQLSILLNNLIDNALRHTPADGKVTVRLQMSIDGSEALELSVADTGVGIAPDQRQAVFQRFYRVPRSLPHDPMHHIGSGLGLAIVAGIAQRHGADIALSDGEPTATGAVGLCVTVRLAQSPQPS